MNPPFTSTMCIPIKKWRDSYCQILGRGLAEAKVHTYMGLSLKATLGVVGFI